MINIIIICNYKNFNIYNNVTIILTFKIFIIIKEQFLLKSIYERLYLYNV